MSLSETNLCGRLLKEHYGDVLEKIGLHLAKKGPSPVGIIAKDTSLKVEQVKAALRVFITQNLVSFEVHKRGFVEYSLLLDQVLRRQRLSRYVYMVRLLYGDVAELLVEELLQHGQVELSRVVKRVCTRLNEALEGENKVTANNIQDQFTNLVQTHFIQRCAGADLCSEETITTTSAPTLKLDPDDQYRVVSMDADFVHGRKRKLSDSVADDNPAKRMKKDNDNAKDKLTDEGIFWKVNFDRFDRYLRDQAIVSAVSRKVDREINNIETKPKYTFRQPRWKQASEVVRTLLRLSEVRSEEEATVTTPLSYNEIFQSLPEDIGMSKQTLEQYLKLLCEDMMEFLQKVGDSGGGMYVIDFQKVLCSLCKCHIESVIQERFGSKSLRIIRLLMLKKQLEQKQIEEFAMIPSKEAKLLLYRMFGEHFIHLTEYIVAILSFKKQYPFTMFTSQEIPKTADHAPSRTYYLFSVNLIQVARNLLQRSYKATYNMLIRRESETRESRRLLEKQQRVEAIAASLEQGGADAAQRQEIEEMITPSEKAQLNRVKHITSKLEHSEIQLDETILILQLYLNYTRNI